MTVLSHQAAETGIFSHQEAMSGNTPFTGDKSDQ
jgi:hypothetical protein